MCFTIILYYNVYFIRQCLFYVSLGNSVDERTQRPWFLLCQQLTPQAHQYWDFPFLIHKHADFSNIKMGKRARVISPCHWLQALSLARYVKMWKTVWKLMRCGGNTSFECSRQTLAAKRNGDQRGRKGVSGWIRGPWDVSTAEQSLLSLPLWHCSSSNPQAREHRSSCWPSIRLVFRLHRSSPRDILKRLARSSCACGHGSSWGLTAAPAYSNSLQVRPHIPCVHPHQSIPRILTTLMSLEHNIHDTLLPVQKPQWSCDISGKTIG